MLLGFSASEATFKLGELGWQFSSSSNCNNSDARPVFSRLIQQECAFRSAYKTGLTAGHGVEVAGDVWRSQVYTAWWFVNSTGSSLCDARRFSCSRACGGLDVRLLQPGGPGPMHPVAAFSSKASTSTDTDTDRASQLS